MNLKYSILKFFVIPATIVLFLIGSNGVANASVERKIDSSWIEYSNGYSYNIKEIENIKEIKIVSIRPFFEGTLQIQSVTTPDPSTRRKFIVMIDYVKRENATAGENNVQSRFITTILEKGEWKIYSINTSP